jgi:RES domain-containing protein
MVVYRIADSRHPIFDATGAMLHGGRWNSVGLRAIYAAETYAGALLEVLVHSNLSQPPKHHRVMRIEVPDKLKVETVSINTVPGWDDEDMRASRDFGDRWIRESRSAVLRVPSVITKGREDNIVFNPAHQDFALIRPGEPELVRWDERLFRRSP